MKAWASVLEASYLCHFLPPFFNNFGKRLVKTPKLYFLDSGVVSALDRQPGGEAGLVGAMGGALFEGWVVSEAHKLFAAAGRRGDLYFWRSNDGLEVDLIIPVGDRLYPVEIKLTATPTIKHVEPLNRFRALAGQSAQEGILVCRVNEPTPLPGGNRAMPWHH